MTRSDYVIYVLLLLFSLLILYPVLHVVSLSLASVKEAAARGFFLFPKEPTFAAFKYAFQQFGIGSAYGITIFRATVGTSISLILTALGAYVLSRKELPFVKGLTTFVIISIIFQGGLIPLFLIVQKLGMYNTIWALILPTSINTFYLIILRNFFSSVPNSLIESGRIDGAGELRMMVQIIFPLSSAAFATIGLFYAVYYWNEFFHAVIFISDNNKMPLQVIIRRMYTGGGDSMYMSDDALPPPTESMRAATIVIATFPILCVYPFLQKYFVKGVMVGAVKG